MSSTATSSTAPMTRSEIHHEGGAAANNCPADRLMTCNARADQWKADCEKAGWDQCWADIAAWAAANGQGRWQAGMALVLSAWALLGLVGVLL